MQLGEQGWRSGVSTRLPPMWRGFKSRRRRHMWVEFVVGSLTCSGTFSPGTTVFPSPQKPTFPNSNSTRNQVDEEPLCGCATCKSLFIYLFIYLFIRYLNFVSTKSDRSLTSSVLSSTAFSSLCRNCNSVVAAEKKDSWAFWNWMIRSNMARSCVSIFYDNNNNKNNLWTYCAQLNITMISCALQLHYFKRNKQKIMHWKIKRIYMHASKNWI